MSLKTFHVFFISVSVLLCIGFGAWCLTAEGVRGQADYTALGLVSLVVAVALIVYEILFLRKFKNTP